jgi:putative phosphoesterase
MPDVTTIAVVADIHGNLPALERVVDDIARRGIDTVINLGDHASGPLWPRETIDFLMTRPWAHIAGNCDRAISRVPPSSLGLSDRFAFDRLGEVQRAWLDDLPATAAFDGVIAFHGTPTSDSTYLLETVDTFGARLARPDEISLRLNGTASDVMLCAHSHMPRVVRIGQSLIVNPGSVGLPAYETTATTRYVMESGSPDAHYAILTRDERGWMAELVTVAYDAESAATVAERNERPDWALALRTGFM